MQANKKPTRSSRNLRATIWVILFLLAGAFFLGVGIFFLINPMRDAQGNPAHGIEYVSLGLGVVAMIAAAVTIVQVLRSNRSSQPLSADDAATNEARFHAGEPNDAGALQNVKLFFHRAGKKSQSFLIEDPAGITRYECRLTKLNSVGANLFDFIDVERNYAKSLKIGKAGTITSMGEDLSSHFKIDGVPCWDYLRQRGYEIRHDVLERPFMRYELWKLGKLVAKITPCNVQDPWNEASLNLLRMGGGYYRIEILDCRLEDAAMVAFIAAQSDLVQ